MVALKVGSLFAGIGAFDLSAHRVGMKVSWCAEIDKQCQSVLRRHFGFDIGWQLIKDVHDVNAADHVRPDIITGGFPCQDISVAGRRAGLAGKRSGLWWEFHRIIRDFLPAGVLIENVAGLLSSNGGRDLGAILRGLGQLGYGWAYRVLNAEWSGVPQRRRRVFIVGCLGDQRRAAEVLFERESLPWDSPPSREAGARVADCLTAGVSAGSEVNRPGRRREDDSNLVAACLNSGGNNGGFRSEPGEHLVPIAFNTTQITSPGNYSNPQPGDPCHPVPANGHAPAVAFQSKASVSQSMNASEVCPAIGTTKTPAVAYQCHGSNVGPMGAIRRGNGNETGGVPFVFQTRIARNSRGQPDEVVSALTSCEGGTHADSKPHVAAKFGVRRLTPRECERLFGLPDDWTRYGHDDKEVSDSARYRMLGNSVVIPDAQWILERLAKALA